MIASRRRFLFGASATLVAAPVPVVAAIEPPVMVTPVLDDEPISIMPGMVTYTNALHGRPKFMPAFDVLPRNMRAVS